MHSQDTLQAFNDEVIAEHAIFRQIKRVEMKELLETFADGQIAMHKVRIATSNDCEDETIQSLTCT